MRCSRCWTAGPTFFQVPGKQDETGTSADYHHRPRLDNGEQPACQYKIADGHRLDPQAHHSSAPGPQGSTRPGIKILVPLSSYGKPYRIPPATVDAAQDEDRSRPGQCAHAAAYFKLFAELRRPIRRPPTMPRWWPKLARCWHRSSQDFDAGQAR